MDSSVVSRLSPLVASSDASALVGSEPNHYTQLYTFLSGLCRPATPEVLCIKTHPSTTVRGSTHGFEVVRAISKAHTNATAHAWRSILAPAVRVLNIEASGLRAFVWSAVELRLYARAHAATRLWEDVNGARSPSYPMRWFENARLQPAWVRWCDRTDGRHALAPRNARRSSDLTTSDLTSRTKGALRARHARRARFVVSSLIK